MASQFRRRLQAWSMWKFAPPNTLKVVQSSLPCLEVIAAEAHLVDDRGKKYVCKVIF